MEPVVNVNEVSRISTGTAVKGEISSQNDIRIDGKFEGRIFSKSRVVIGENAVIKGDVICSNVDLWGKMYGDFYVKDTLSLKDTSEVEGNLHIKKLQVELNAKFNGTCSMIDDAQFSQFASSVLPNDEFVPVPDYSDDENARTDQA